MPIPSILSLDTCDRSATITDWLRNGSYPDAIVVGDRRELPDVPRTPELVLFHPGTLDAEAVDVCRELRGRYPDARILTLPDAPPDTPAVIDTLRAGADDCLPFPKTPAEFLARFEGWTRRTGGSSVPVPEPHEPPEERLAASERHYRLLFERNPQPVLIYDIDTLSVLDVNNAAVCRYGYSREEFLSLSIRDLRPPEDIPALEKNVEAVKTSDEVRIDHAGVWRHRLKDGTIIFVEITSQPLEFQGRSAEMVLAYDVTERQQIEATLRESEKRFTSFMRNLPGVAFIKDQAGRHIFVNEGWEKLFHLDIAAARGKTDDELFPARVAAQFKANDRELLRRGEPIRVIEQTEHEDGFLHWLVAKFLISNSENGTGLIGGIAIDVTAEKEAEREIVKLNAELENRVAERTAQLEAVNQELESFSYSVSHDLRAPLRGIDGFTQALEDHTAEHLDETARRYMSRIRGAAERMGELIDDLLDLSRLSRTELSRSDVDLSQLAREIADGLKQSDPERRVETIVEPGVVCQGDPRLLRILLENLLNNAWKFTSSTAEARIEFAQERSENGSAVCFVRDNGVGFDMRYAHKLFGPFQRLHGMSEFPGTGIGLATVKRIVQLHGGSVWAHGKPGEGSAFSFTL